MPGAGVQIDVGAQALKLGVAQRTMCGSAPSSGTMSQLGDAFVERDQDAADSGIWRGPRIHVMASARWICASQTIDPFFSQERLIDWSMPGRGNVRHRPPARRRIRSLRWAAADDMGATGNDGVVNVADGGRQNSFGYFFVAQAIDGDDLAAEISVGQLRQESSSSAG